MPRTLQKKIRISEEQWKRLETEAADLDTTANRLVVQLALEALDRREWPRTEPEIQLFRSVMFSAQAIARNMIAEGRDDEVEEIRKEISRIAPAFHTESSKDTENKIS